MGSKMWLLSPVHGRIHCRLRRTMTPMTVRTIITTNIEVIPIAIPVPRVLPSSEVWTAESTRVMFAETKYVSTHADRII